MGKIDLLLRLTDTEISLGRDDFLFPRISEVLKRASVQGS